MARLVLLPVADRIESGTYLLYDGACGTGGMLTVGEEILKDLAAARGILFRPPMALPFACLVALGRHIEGFRCPCTGARRRL
jgi:hypothetical protein